MVFNGQNKSICDKQECRDEINRQRLEKAAQKRWELEEHDPLNVRTPYLTPTQHWQRELRERVRIFAGV